MKNTSTVLAGSENYRDPAGSLSMIGLLVVGQVFGFRRSKKRYRVTRFAYSADGDLLIQYQPLDSFVLQSLVVAAFVDYPIIIF